MNTWSTRIFSEIASYEKKRYEGSGLPYVGLEDIESDTGKFLGSRRPKSVRSSTFHFDKTYILYGRLRPYLNKVLLPDFEGHCSSEIFPISVSDECDRRFLFHWLMWSKTVSAIDETSTGARMPRANMREVLGFPVPVPPMAEQTRIVAILDEAFEAIDRAKEIATLNAANARELFNSYLNRVFSEKGEGCEAASLESLCERITKGSSPRWQGFDYVDKPGLLFVTSENVGDNCMVFDKEKYVDEAFNERNERSILKCEDVLTNLVGASIGRTAIFDREDDANINQAVGILRCIPDRLVNHYLSYLLNSPYFRKVLHDNEVNSARANISLTFLKQLKIPLPSLQDQQVLVSAFNQLRGLSNRLETIELNKVAALDELKQSILQKAFTGQLTADSPELEAVL